MKLRLKLALAALLTIGLSSAAAHADSLTFTLRNPTGYVLNTGSTYTYFATVSAPTTNLAAIFLNGDSFNLTAPFSLNDSAFFNNFPLSLAPGASYTGALFTVTSLSGSPFGNYVGSFTLLGGPNGISSATLGTVNFSVATTPEPSSVMLSLTGVLGVAAMFWAGYRKDAHGWAR